MIIAFSGVKSSILKMGQIGHECQIFSLKFDIGKNDEW